MEIVTRGGVVAGPLAWSRGQARLSGNEVVVKRPQAYVLHAADDLPYELAAATKPAEVAAFVGTWGLLWSGPRGSQSEGLADWFPQVESMHTTLYSLMLVQMARREDDSAAAYLALWNAVRSGNAPHERLRHPEREIGEIPAGVLRRFRRDALPYSPLVASVRSEVAAFVRSRLDGRVEYSLQTGATGAEENLPDFALAVSAADLVSRAYLQVVLEMTRGTPIRACLEDGRLFPVRDARQRYCSVRCAGRARSRRFAERRRTPGLVLS
jgi:hypothetical protein